MTTQIGKPRLIVLLGAGASIPAGMPTTEDITKRMRSGENVSHKTDDTYVLTPNSHQEATRDEHTPRVIQCLNAIHDHIEPYFRRHLHRDPNYEDYYFYANQIRDSIKGEYENAALEAETQRLGAALWSTLRTDDGELRKDWLLHELLDEVCKYTVDVVRCLLDQSPSTLDHFSFIRYLARHTAIKEVDVFTLNHDTLLEQYFDREQISYADGFGEELNHVRYWKAEYLSDSKAEIRLVKLHGSIDWFRLYSESLNDPSYQIGKVLQSDFEHTVDHLGRPQITLRGCPLILAGTFNKMLSYLSDIYMELHYQFYSAMRSAKWLLIVGYGFGDKGVNNRINDWLAGSAERQLIIVHGDTAKLMEQARPAISRSIEILLRQNPSRVHIISKWIQDLTRNDINDMLES